MIQKNKVSRVILHHIRVIYVEFYQNGLTKIQASQMEKHLSRLSYRICSSGVFSFDLGGFHFFVLFQPTASD